ncbi:MAG: hypothetical protein ACOYN5_01535 [Bacteroidales bacterium]
MRAQIIICLMVLVCVLAIGDSAYSITPVDSVSYPIKPPETSLEDVVAAGKGVLKESTELGTAMAQGVIDDGGIVATIKHHKKFYGTIAIFSFLFLLRSLKR